jgi:penicillin-insensitive murein DD-endopeptidase
MPAMGSGLIDWRARTSIGALRLLAAFVVLLGIGGPAAAGWGSAGLPTANPPQVYGGHAAGCLDGASALPLDGDGYQVMRPSRNRFYGHPVLIAFVEDLARQAVGIDIDGLLIGDLAQPRGGPMTSGHRSHQTGLDVDIWFRFARPRSFTPAERESVSATSMILADGSMTNPAWTDRHAALLHLTAIDPRVDRIFVNPAIKRFLCDSAEGDRQWLSRIRPWWGHDHHFHVSLLCPAGDADCRDRSAPPPPGTGCDASLDWWFSAEAVEELRKSRAAPPKVLTLDDLPGACRGVLTGR